MTWLTWRQHRADAVMLALLIACLGVGVILLLALYAPRFPGMAEFCTGGPAETTSCTSVDPQVNATLWALIDYGGLLLPVLVGTFVGAATVARELENPTHVLAWTQGISRREWFRRRVLLLSLGGVAAAALCAAAMQGWFAAQRGAGASIWQGFDIAPPVLVAYTLFALCLGTAAGAALKRTTPAVLLTVVVYIAVRVTIALLARPRYLPPVTATFSATHSGAFLAVPTGDWPVGPTVCVDAAGRAVGSFAGAGFCALPPPAVPVLGGDHYPISAIAQVQPETRFWLFQGIEAVIFVVLALALLALAHRLVMRVR